VCIYCGKRADSNEHIIATWIIDLLAQDSRGFRLPTRLNVTLPSGATRRIRGATTKRGKPTLEYTTRVCHKCNSEWMNIIDENARPYLTAMIRGQTVALNANAQAAVAAWIMKVAVTARSEPNNPLPIERPRTDWLYTHRSPIPDWHVWIGWYIGSEPFWYNPHDIGITPLPGSPRPLPDGGAIRDHGVLATLAIGYLIVQVFGVSGGATLFCADEEALIKIWPTTRALVKWPPLRHIDDAGLPLFAERLLTNAAPPP
jgi:hypothetical protein